METETAYAIELTFSTSQHGAMTIAVPGADPSVDDGEVAAAMGRVIASGAVLGPSGRPSAIKKAELVATGVTEYELD